jgi:hypothetical protein
MAAARNAWWLNAAAAVLLDADAMEEEPEVFYCESKPRPQYRQSYWFKMLVNQRDRLADPTCKEGRQFRRRFSVPFCMYEELLGWANAWFLPSLVDASGP